MVKGLNNTELVGLSDFISVLERDTIFEMGLEQIPGGFAKAECVEFNTKDVTVALKYGTDCKVHTQLLTLPRTEL